MVVGDDYEQFCAASWPRLVAGLIHYFGDQQVAEDAAQEALIRAGLAWSRVSTFASPLGWAFRVGSNVGNSELRRRGAERRATRRLDDQLSSDQLTRIEVSDVLQRALADLSPQQRRVIIARFYLDLSVADSASVLGMSEGAVRAASHRGIEKLRGSLRPTFELTEEAHS